jgi:hypothetical protein
MQVCWRKLKISAVGTMPYHMHDLISAAYLLPLHYYAQLAAISEWLLPMAEVTEVHLPPQCCHNSG